jgi:hypothetical protein
MRFVLAILGLLLTAASPAVWASPAPGVPCPSNPTCYRMNYDYIYNLCMFGQNWRAHWDCQQQGVNQAWYRCRCDEPSRG